MIDLITVIINNPFKIRAEFISMEELTHLLFSELAEIVKNLHRIQVATDMSVEWRASANEFIRAFCSLLTYTK